MEHGFLIPTDASNLEIQAVDHLVFITILNIILFKNVE